jgi:hypothetical protein
MTGARETWWVARDVREALERVGIDSVVAAMARAACGQILSRDRQSATVLIDGGSLGPLVLKWRRPLPRRRLRTWVRPSRERREARGVRLLPPGLGEALAALAVAERRRRGFLEGAILLRRHLPGTTFSALLRGGGADDEAARALRRLHDLGYRHGDCYPKNLLLPDGGGPVLPLGAPKARRVRAGARLDRLRRKDLAQWAAGRREARPDLEPFAFLAHYLEAPGLPPRTEVEARLLPLHERVMARKAARRRTQPLREPGGPPPPAPLPPDRGPVHRVLRPPAEA